MIYAKYVHVPDEAVVDVEKQEAIEREFFCRGVRYNPTTKMWGRCGNASKYYVFVDGADEARQAICGVCRRKARNGRLTVLK
jgi:hypothetical protein